MTTKSPLFSFVSLGCARTLVDSEVIVNDLKGAGFTLVPEGSHEAIVVLNTCSFIQAAIDETEANIQTFLEKKDAGEIKHLAVVGCYTSRFKKEDLEAKYPNVDIWLTTKEEHLLKQELSQLVFEKKFSPSTPAPYTKLTPSHFSYLKISEGCDNWCSFCTIPKIRGTHTSVPIDQLKQQIALQQQFGAKEINLIAEDTTAWGEDLFGKPSFDILLDELASTGVEWIRPMYIFPSRVNENLMQVMAKHDNITNYIDMPIQHVSTDLLESMNRRHDKAFLEKILKDFVRINPGMVVRTTFILGYPGETEEHVDELIDFIERYPFEQLGCFGYSEEKETRSARIQDKIPPSIIQERIHKVMSRQFELVQERGKARVGQTYTILVEDQGIGRAEFQAPDVDGRILFEGKAQPGTFIDVTITGMDGYDFTADSADELTKK